MADVAIQGERGSFSHEAAVQTLGPDSRILSCSSFEELFARVVDGDTPYGVVPVENTLAGSVTENLDLLTRHDVRVTGETRVRVELCAVARPGSSLEESTVAASHPVALRQCRGFFRAHPWIDQEVVWDTAGSVRDLLDGSPSYDLAIGSALAADLFGGEILQRGLEDDPANFTRFLLVTGDRGGARPTPAGPVRTALAFVVPHRPGSLHRALGALAGEGLDLTRLESRPIPGRPWEYRFYADASAENAEAMDRAVVRLDAEAREVRVFGTWGSQSNASTPRERTRRP